LDLTTEGFFWDGSFKLSENFAVEKEGLRFYYNAYEVAPYAVDPTDLVIPRSELRKVTDTGRLY
jgi:hypothetical protein